MRYGRSTAAIVRFPSVPASASVYILRRYGGSIAIAGLGRRTAWTNRPPPGGKGHVMLSAEKLTATRTTAPEVASTAAAHSDLRCGAARVLASADRNTSQMTKTARPSLIGAT